MKRDGDANAPLAVSLGVGMQIRVILDEVLITHFDKSKDMMQDRT